MKQLITMKFMNVINYRFALTLCAFFLTFTIASAQIKNIFYDCVLGKSTINDVRENLAYHGIKYIEHADMFECRDAWARLAGEVMPTMAFGFYNGLLSGVIFGEQAFYFGKRANNTDALYSKFNRILSKFNTKYKDTTKYNYQDPETGSLHYSYMSSETIVLIEYIIESDSNRHFLRVSYLDGYLNVYAPDENDGDF